MEIDNDKINEAVLDLMYLTLHDGYRAWKSFDPQKTTLFYSESIVLSS